MVRLSASQVLGPAKQAKVGYALNSTYLCTRATCRKETARVKPGLLWFPLLPNSRPPVLDPTLPFLIPPDAEKRQGFFEILLLSMDSLVSPKSWGPVAKQVSEHLLLLCVFLDICRAGIRNCWLS
jgi:hypothetical protein